MKRGQRSDPRRRQEGRGQRSEVESSSEAIGQVRIQTSARLYRLRTGRQRHNFALCPINDKTFFSIKLDMDAHMFIVVSLNVNKKQLCLLSQMQPVMEGGSKSKMFARAGDFGNFPGRRQSEHGYHEADKIAQQTGHQSELWSHQM